MAIQGYVSSGYNLIGSLVNDLPVMSAELLAVGDTWTSTDWTGSWAVGWTHPTGTIETISLGATGSGGSGYAIGDILSVDTGGGTGGRVKVKTLSGSAVATFELMSVTGTAKGSGYAVGNNYTTTYVTGTGTGATVNVLTINNTTALTDTGMTAPTIGYKYQVAWTVSAASVGTFTVTIGGQVSAATTVGATSGNFGPTATTIGKLIITPTATFNGTIVISVKRLTAVSTPLSVWQDSGNVSRCEIRESTSANNTAVGLLAGGYFTTGIDNTAIGSSALASDTSGSYNSALGYQALYANTLGTYNTAVGYLSLTANLTGTGNTAIGYGSLKANTSGIQNTAVGEQALWANLVGGQNTACGEEALYACTGSNNSGFGFNALGNVGAGGTNTGLGTSALCNVSTGSGNVGVGYVAGRYGADGSTQINPNSSTYLGSYTKGLSSSDDNSTVIGYYAVGMGANTVVLGNDAVLTTALKGDVFIRDANDLGSETLTNPNLTGGTSWAGTNDCVLASDKATWTYSSGLASTLTQAQADLAITPGKSSKWYRFTYTVSGSTGTPTAFITTSFASVSTALMVGISTTQITYFRSAASPTDFIITSTLTAGQAFTLDTFSLKEVTGGDLTVAGNVGIGTADINSKAVIDIASTTRGVLLPRMNTVQRDLITSAPEGLEIYNTTTHQKEFYYGSWMNVAANSITTSKIAFNAVTADQLADNAVITRHILANNVTDTKLADNAVISRHILENNVTTIKIAFNNVTVDQIANNAVTSRQIEANAVIDGKIADNAVTNRTIYENAVTEPKIADNAITARQIAHNAITSNAVVNLSTVSGAYVTDALNTLSAGGGGFTLTENITSDVDLIGVASKYVCTYIIVENTTANVVTINIGTSDPGTEIASFSLGNLGLYTVTVNKMFSTTTSTPLYVSSLAWNAANINVSVCYVKGM